MKRLYVCGNFKFLHEIEELEAKLKEEDIEYQTSKKMANLGIPGCLNKVDDADIVYVVNPQGYIGKSVSVDIGYAYAENKSIWVMHPIDDPLNNGSDKRCLISGSFSRPSQGKISQATLTEGRL